MHIIIRTDAEADITQLFLLEGKENEYIRNWYWKDNQLLKKSLVNTTAVEKDFIPLLSMPTRLFNRMMKGIEQHLKDNGGVTAVEEGLRTALTDKEEQMKSLEKLSLKTFSVLENTLDSLQYCLSFQQ